MYADGQLPASAISYYTRVVTNISHFLNFFQEQCTKWKKFKQKQKRAEDQHLSRVSIEKDFNPVQLKEMMSSNNARSFWSGL